MRARVRAGNTYTHVKGVYSISSRITYPVHPKVNIQHCHPLQRKRTKRKNILDGNSCLIFANRIIKQTFVNIIFTCCLCILQDIHTLLHKKERKKTTVTEITIFFSRTLHGMRERHCNGGRLSGRSRKNRRKEMIKGGNLREKEGRSQVRREGKEKK